MNPWEGDQIGLELVQIDVQGSIETQRRSDGRNDLGNQSVKVGEGWRSDSQVSPTDVVDTAVVSETPNIETHASLSTMNEQSECSSVV